MRVSAGINEKAAGSDFITYALTVATERPRSWTADEPQTLKAKLIFEQYSFGLARRTGRKNTLAIYTAGDVRHDFAEPIVTIGSLAANNIVLKDGSVSRRHCAIVNYPDDVWLYDLESTVGTTCDGQNVIDRIHLDGVHEVTVGDVAIRVASHSDKLL